MAVGADEGLLDYMRRHSGAIEIELRGVADREAAERALAVAQAQVGRVPHPEMPAAPFVSFISGISHGERGPRFWFDMADAEAYVDVLECTLDLMLTALDDRGLSSGWLSWPESGATRPAPWRRSPEGRWDSVLNLYTDDPEPDEVGDVAIRPIGELPANWAQRAPLPTLRSRMSAATGADGRVYVVGGDRRGPVKTVEVYDPATDRWRRCRSLHEPRRGPGVAAAPDGRIIALGGYGGRTSTVEAYDPASDRWEFVAPMLDEPLNDMAAAGTADGRIYAFAFEGRRDGNLFQCYDVEQDAWAVLAPPRRRYAGVASLVAGMDGRIYALGFALGDGETSAEVYEPGEDRWTDIAPLGVMRAFFGAVCGADGRIHVFGGTVGMYEGVPAVERYDPAADAWTVVDELPTPRGGPAVARLADGSICVIGGYVQVMIDVDRAMRARLLELTGMSGRPQAVDVGAFELYRPT